MTVSVHAGLITRIIEQFASEALRDEYLPRMCSGEWLGGFALTEAESGSDASGLRSRAVRDGDHYVLDGRKQWVTNGGYAKAFVVFARTGVAGPKGQCGWKRKLEAASGNAARSMPRCSVR